WSLRRRGFGLVDVYPPLPEINHWVQGGMLVIGGTPTLEPRIRLGREVVCEHLDEARFPNPRLPMQQHHLPHALLDLGPTPLQQGEFGFPSHQWGEASRGRHVQAALSLARLEYLTHLKGGGHTTELLSTEIAAGKIALNEAKRGATNDDRIRRCQTLEPRRNIRRFPQRQLFSSAAAELANHDQARMDPQPHGQLGTVRQPETRM